MRPPLLQHHNIQHYAILTISIVLSCSTVIGFTPFSLKYDIQINSISTTNAFKSSSCTLCSERPTSFILPFHLRQHQQLNDYKRTRGLKMILPDYYRDHRLDNTHRRQRERQQEVGFDGDNEQAQAATSATTNNNNNFDEDYYYIEDDVVGKEEDDDYFFFDNEEDYDYEQNIYQRQQQREQPQSRPSSFQPQPAPREADVLPRSNPYTNNYEKFDEYSNAEQQQGNGDEFLYTDSDDEEELVDDESWVWESYKGGTEILLPPETINGKIPEPKAILHFIGGTFFGSLPSQISYRSLLEGIARSHMGDVIIISTSIPLLLDNNKGYGSTNSPDVDLPSFVSPLNHWEKVHIINRNLYGAIRDVVMDEYPYLTTPSDIPIIGVGHSLGARLLLLMHSSSGDSSSQKTTATLDYHDNYYDNLKFIGNIMISFNNYNARRSIPLLDELQSFMDIPKNLFNNNAQRYRIPDYENIEFDPSPETLWKFVDRAGSTNPIQQDIEKDAIEDNDGEEDEDDLTDDRRGRRVGVNRGVGRGRRRQKKFRRNKRSSSQEQMMREKKQKEKQFKYSIKRNLIVQFDNDELDQSAELAKRILSPPFPNQDSAQYENDFEEYIDQNRYWDNQTRILAENNNGNNDDISFARLRGNHLTPCALPGDLELILKDNYIDHEDEGITPSQSASKGVVNSASTRGNKNSLSKRDKRRKDELINLISTLVTYINTIVETSKLEEMDELMEKQRQEYNSRLSDRDPRYY